MLCLACSGPAWGPVCPSCTATLRPAPQRVLPSGLRVVAAFSHEGAARLLVHRLKYGPVAGVADCLAQRMAEGAGAVDALVPVPRAPLRRWRTGVDPARQLAAALGRIVGLPVVDALAAPLWWPRHAGRPRAERASIRFRAKCPVFGAVAIIDDVVTTGRTLESAASAVAGMPSLALVATSAGSMSVG